MRSLVIFVLLLFVAVVSFGLSPAQAEIMLGLTADFQDLTTQGWGGGLAFAGQPEAVVDADSREAGDAYLRVTSTGTGGPGSRLIALNTDQWAGDYIAANVTGIEMFLNNLGSNELSMRVALGGPDPNNDTWFASTDAVTLSPGSGWTAVSFPITEAALTRVNGTASYTDVFSDVPVVRILSSGVPALRGDPIAAELGVDEVTAVPEPSVAAMVLVLGVAGAARRRRTAVLRQG